MAAVHLSVHGTAIDVGGARRVDRDLCHAVGRCVSDVDSFPGLADVATAKQGAGFRSAFWSSPSTGSSGQVHSFGIIRCHQQATTVRTTREHLADLHVFPVPTAMTTAEHCHL